jgi:septum formation protein
VTLILASRSEARRRLLAAAGVEFEVVTPAVDEAALREALAAEATPTEEAATALADMKARRVATVVPPEAIVLGCDQLLELDDEWLEKPGDLDAAREQLRRLRGRVHTLASAVVGFRNGARVWQHVAFARLHMRAFSDRFLESYLDRVGESVLGSVGAYQLEGPGAQLMAEVEGDHFTVQGLPLLAVLGFLRDQGVLER